MSTDRWDPLENQKLTPEQTISSIKREIQNILESYTGWYDPFSELIQNALDAIDARRKTEKDFKNPSIWITVDLKENQLSVCDNGIGFAEDEFKAFLAPNLSFKSGNTRGQKGVGATYLAYGFNWLQIGTKGRYSYVGTIEGGREWVEDNTNTKSRPKVELECTPETGQSDVSR